MNVVSENCCVMIHALHESASREAVVNHCVVLHTPQRALNHLRLSPCGFIFMLCGGLWTKGRDVGSLLVCASAVNTGGFASLRLVTADCIYFVII